MTGSPGDGTTPSYDYDDAGLKVHLSSTDASRNNAVQVGGYSLNVRPQTDWPGLSSDPNQIRLREDEMLQVATGLRQEAQRIRSLPTALAQGAKAANFGPVQWVQATNLSSASNQVSDAVTQYVSLVATNLEQAAASIETALGTYDRSDHVSQTATTQVDSNLGGGPVVA